MNDTIASLIKLQDLDKEWAVLRKDMAALGPRREEVRGRIKGLHDAFEGSKSSLTQAQVEKKNLELEIESREQAVRKHTAELNSVKSNDAYKALLTQIEDAKKVKFDLEDQVLAVMERIESLQKDLKEREQALQRDKGALEQKVAELDAEESRLGGTAAAKKQDRDAFAQTLPAAAVERYEAIRRDRDGFQAMAAVRDMTCGGCRTSIPPGVVNDVMKGREALSCENCSRLLYIPPEDPAPAPASAPAAPAS